MSKSERISNVECDATSCEYNVDGKCNYLKLKTSGNGEKGTLYVDLQFPGDLTHDDSIREALGSNESIGLGMLAVSGTAIIAGLFFSGLALCALGCAVGSDHVSPDDTIFKGSINDVSTFANSLPKNCPANQADILENS